MVYAKIHQGGRGYRPSSHHDVIAAFDMITNEAFS